MKNNNKNYQQALDYITQCYREALFPEKEFMFYENRRDYKNEFRTGIYTPEDMEKMFFKVLDEDFTDQERQIILNLDPNFDIIKTLLVQRSNGHHIHLYPYVDTHDIDGYSYLRKKDISLDDKRDKLAEFWGNMENQITCSIKTGYSTSQNESNALFYPRLTPKGRNYDYYGRNYEMLLQDIQNLAPEFLENFKILVADVEKERNSKHPTVHAYTHGDFHDFNYDGLFWDLDTFGNNPITNDFAIYFWHFFSREDNLVPKYNYWLSKYMDNQLDENELSDVRDEKQIIVENYYNLIRDMFIQEGKGDVFEREITLKLFCRAFLIDNVLKFDEQDRKQVYAFWQNYMEKLGTQDFEKEILFPHNANNIDDAFGMEEEK
ncbi:MAG: hypothetical protein FWE01_00955 [Firmicutes bacterium]|nr:hypothetical protein [Bacillota bacterium]